MVFGIASSSNFTAPPTHSNPFHSETKKQDRNYLLDLILFVWEAVMLREDSSENSPVLLTTPVPSWAIGFTCCLHSHPWKSISDVSEGERSPTKCGGGEIYPTQIPPALLAVIDSRPWSSYVFQAYFRIQHLEVYMSENNKFLPFVSAAPGDRRGCCDV